MQENVILAAFVAERRFCFHLMARPAISQKRKLRKIERRCLIMMHLQRFGLLKRTAYIDKI